eukprot:13016212-Alexandrium_andersonii.AAC.1
MSLHSSIAPSLGAIGTPPKMLPALLDRDSPRFQGRSLSSDSLLGSPKPPSEGMLEAALASPMSGTSDLLHRAPEVAKTPEEGVGQGGDGGASTVAAASVEQLQQRAMVAPPVGPSFAEASVIPPPPPGTGE